MKALTEYSHDGQQRVIFRESFGKTVTFNVRVITSKEYELINENSNSK